MSMLETRLPGQVSDNRLFKLTEASFSVAFDETVSAANRLIRIVSYSDAASKIKLRLVGDVYFTDATLSENYGQEITTLGGYATTNVYVSNGTGILFIGGCTADGLNRMEFSSGSKVGYLGGFLNDFDGGVLRLPAVNLSGYTVEDVFPKNPYRLTTFEAPGSKLSGSFENTEGSNTLVGLAIYNTYVSGDVMQFAKFKGLGSLHFANCVDIFGTLESLLDAMFAAGRVSSSLSINASGTKVTYNGSLFATKTATFTSSGWTVA